ncbi:PadR family transcriptional regulator [Halobacillus sp. B29]|uniref:PadR family transcriptional regulator n=1 Tax=Halobacillus sp. B29 TaxID=3457432 RepID=UPI003FCC78C5
MSTVNLLVLGSIKKRGISHGYALYRDITSWHADTWTNVKPGSIYYALEKLESKNLTNSVNSKTEKKLGPAKKEYAITEQGEIEFLSLIKTALTSSDLQQLSAGIAFMDFLYREEVIHLLQQRLDTLKDSSNFLKGLPTDENTLEPPKHPELVGVWVSYVNNEISTTERIIKNISEGKYNFKPRA